MAKNNKTLGKSSINKKNTTPKKKWKLPVVLVSVFAVVLIVASVLVGRGVGGTADVISGETDNTNGQDLVIPTSEISETARFYPVDVDGTQLEVVAVKASDGSIRTAFNTCQICYDSGRGYYKQQGNVLVCQNCGNQFSMDRVEIEAGGCNPWPIFDEDKSVTESNITIPYGFLSKSSVIFANWKKSY
ncbi:DUF2318 domain-containing protein [Oscillospiraceae bacterium MB08-C2-2]|nr:DUF2318 domain-containing protein [Oscillospiraceae bacterium MB08-C2-2]